MEITPAASFLSSVDGARLQAYAEYWDRLAPSDDWETFQRWLFAYASVHTTWESNVSLFNAIKGCEWLGDKEALRQRIIESRAGLHNNRAEFIIDFADKFWSNPGRFAYDPNIPWFDFRRQVDKSIRGLGRAKIAFAYEMIYPSSVQLVCLDTHILQLYGYAPSLISSNHIKDRDFESIEQHWIATCSQRKIPPALARFMYWDNKQGKPNSRYWSYVLEAEAKKSEFDKLEKLHMDIAQAKAEFVTRVAPMVAPAFAKKEAAELPTTVGKLIEWFMTADYSKLQPFKFDNNWEVLSTEPGCRDNSKGLKLVCGYIDLKSDDVVYPLAVRPANSTYVMLNENISEHKAGKTAWEMLMPYKAKYILTAFTDAESEVTSKPSKFLTASNGIMQFEIGGSKWLYVPHTNHASDKPPAMISGVLVKTNAHPQEEFNRRAGCVACFGPYYLKSGINPLTANAKTDVEQAYAAQAVKLIRVLDLSDRAQKHDTDSKTKAAFKEAIKGMNFGGSPDDRNEQPYQVNRAAMSQMRLCWHPKSPVRFLGIVDPNTSLSLNGTSYRLTATAMAKAGNKVYVTGTVYVQGNDWYSFKRLDVKEGEWYEVTKMPGVMSNLQQEEE